jgi:hypothetical protein
MRFLIFIFPLVVCCAAQPYFPPKAAPDPEWYSDHLKALREAPLYVPKPDPKVETYRFIWLRTFHRPVVFRVDAPRGAAAQFTIKVADGKGGYEPGKLVRNEKRDLDDETLDRIRGAFTHGKFFELPSLEDRGGADGATWIIEAVSGGRYHVVIRWSPDAGPVHRIGKLLIEHAIGGDLVPIY